MKKKLKNRLFALLSLDNNLSNSQLDDLSVIL